MNKNSDSKEVIEYLVENFRDKLKGGIDFTTEFGDVTFEDNDGPDGVRADGQDFGIILGFLGRYFRLPVLYSSWNGSDYLYDDIEEVEPYTPTVTYYRSIKK